MTNKLKDLCSKPISQDELVEKHDQVMQTISQSKSRGSLIPITMRIKKPKEKQTTFVVNIGVVKDALESDGRMGINGKAFKVERFKKERLIFTSLEGAELPRKLVRQRAELDNSVGWDAQRHVHIKHVLKDKTEVDCVITTLSSTVAKKIFENL